MIILSDFLYGFSFEFYFPIFFYVSLWKTKVSPQNPSL
ncbi:hypothetical protein LEP1GSC166_0933 [Leptospira kirschneri]|nr:hypothetical protein LEP1GSC198_1564 [Leptospira kirschneri str. JB]EMK04833.1 hypothetical protein LEP1GSC166_0933 [Leptospira kirschneri]